MNSGHNTETGAAATNGNSGQATKRACVFCNGTLKSPDRARALAGSSDLVIAADGGTEHLVVLGVKPDAIIGDMDSLGTETKWAGDDILRVPHPSDKDKSDAELAVEYALAQGCRQVALIAAAGKRLDHTLGNIALMAKYPGRVAIVDGTFTLVAVNRSERCVLHGSIGATVSLIPYGSGLATVTTRGLKYALQNEPLAFATHGLSNELSETEACVCVAEGILLVCIETGIGERNS